MLLEVQGISVRLGSAEVLKDVTFRLEKAEMLALLGPNGSGKSTLLKTIFGALKPKIGAVYLDGKRIAEMRIEDVAKIIGYLPQESLVTNLRVIDVVLLGRTPYLNGLKNPSLEDLKIAKKALRSVKLEGFEHRIFSQLSGGEKQKVLLARTLAQEAKILLLDEPTSYLDISSQIDIMRILKDKLSDGCSAIVAMHDINLASSFCDRILMIKDGRVVYAGNPREVITPGSIKEVFGAEVMVKKHAGKLFVIPELPKNARKGKWVHVICGGGSGESIIYMLDAEGYGVSAGVLNALDSDWEAATKVGRVIGEAPFSPVSKEAYEENLRMVEQSDAVVLANVCIGSGNLLNLHTALKAAKLNKLFVINKLPFAERNFCGKEAEEVYRGIIELVPESRILKNEKELLEDLNEVLD
jgi:iron complex transport system ATP-binding protein